jgi:hypothetical protein
MGHGSHEVDFAALQFEKLKFSACFTDGDDFGVRGGIVRGSDAIHALGDDFSRLHHDGAKRTAPRGAHVLDRKLNGARHKRIRHPTSISCVANFRGPEC